MYIWTTCIYSLYIYTYTRIYRLIHLFTHLFIGCQTHEGCFCRAPVIRTVSSGSLRQAAESMRRVRICFQHNSDVATIALIGMIGSGFPARLPGTLSSPTSLWFAFLGIVILHGWTRSQSFTGQSIPTPCAGCSLPGARQDLKK